jgi:hypothetical protein
MWVPHDPSRWGAWLDCISQQPLQHSGSACSLNCIPSSGGIPAPLVSSMVVSSLTESQVSNSSFNVEFASDFSPFVCDFPETEENQPVVVFDFKNPKNVGPRFNKLPTRRFEIVIHYPLFFYLGSFSCCIYYCTSSHITLAHTCIISARSNDQQFSLRYSTRTIPSLQKPARTVPHR